jgi:hypothetical protein
LKANLGCLCLKVARNMNNWGTIQSGGQYERPAAKILVGTGTKALPCLFSFLNDTTRLKYGWNFDTYTLPYEYKWRKKDFAYRYACLILKENFAFPKEPEKRDEIIEAFVKKYGKEWSSKDR